MRFFLILLLFMPWKTNAAALNIAAEDHKPLAPTDPKLSYSTQMLLMGVLGCGSTVNPLSVEKTTTPTLYSLINQSLNLENVEYLEGILERCTAEKLQIEFQIANPVIRMSSYKSQQILDNLRRDFSAIHRFLTTASIPHTP